MSTVENFLYVEWKEDVAHLICFKCEEPLLINPLSEENTVWCTVKQVYVPHCHKCGVSDIENIT